MLFRSGLGPTGGTLDKLESIPGFRTDLDEKIRRRDPLQLQAVGALEAGGEDHRQAGDGVGNVPDIVVQAPAAAARPEYVVLDNDDGKLLPTLENREEVIRQIRGFRADVVVSPRPNDYHPDHRNTGQLVMDAAYMVTVPNIVPSVPHLMKNPVFLYMWDRFTEPSPFVPDIVVAIDDVIEQKIDMYHCHESQMYEWLPYNQGMLDAVPRDPAPAAGSSMNPDEAGTTAPTVLAVQRYLLYGLSLPEQIGRAHV